MQTESMLVLAGTLLGLLVAGAAVLLVVGGAEFVDGWWKDGAVSLAAGVVLPVVALILAGMARC